MNSGVRDCDDQGEKKRAGESHVLFVLTPIRALVVLKAITSALLAHRRSEIRRVVKLSLRRDASCEQAQQACRVPSTLTTIFGLAALSPTALLQSSRRVCSGPLGGYRSVPMAYCITQDPYSITKSLKVASPANPKISPPRVRPHNTIFLRTQSQLHFATLRASSSAPGMKDAPRPCAEDDLHA